MNRIIQIFVLIFLFCSNFAYGVDIPYMQFGFFSQSAKARKVRLKVIGKVVEVKNNKRGLLARLFQKNLTKKGEKLYILNRSGLIIGEIKVKYVFSTLYFGQMLDGVGYFRLIPNDSLVAKSIQNLSLGNDFLIKKFIGKGENFYEEKSIGEAIRYYKKALSINPENPQALLGLGKCYLSQRIWNVAEKYFNLALQYKQNLISKEDLSELYLYQADIYIKKTRNKISDKKSQDKINRMNYKRALGYIKMGLEIGPESGIFNYYAGRLEYLLGRDKFALLYLRNVIKKGGQFLFESYWLIGKIFKEKGMKEKAYPYYIKAQKIKPFHRILKKEIIELRR